MPLLIIPLAIVVYFVMRHRVKKRRRFSGDVFADLLELEKPYRGPKWRVGGWF